MSVHTLHCTNVKFNLTFHKSIGSCGRWWWMTVHGNSLKSTKKYVLPWKQTVIDELCGETYSIKRKKDGVYIEKKRETFSERRHLHGCDLWPWCVNLTLLQGQESLCRLLYCALVPGMISMNVIVCEILPLIYFCDLWPSPVTFSLCHGHFHSSRCALCSCTLVPSIKFSGSIEFEIWTIVCRKLKWRHNDVITHSNLIKFKHNSIKGLSKQQTEFHFNRT